MHFKKIKRVRARYDNLSSETIGFMTTVSDFRNPSTSTNEIISKYFQDDLEIVYPAILFFQVDKTEVIDALLVSLDEQTIEATFLELQKYLKSAVWALKGISKQYKNNYKEIFDQMELSVKKTKFIKKIKRYSKIAKSAFDLASVIKGL